MHKILLFASILLSACASEVVNFAQRERNPKCEDVHDIEVFQVFSDGALAFTCERNGYDDCSWGVTVAVPKSVSDILYDKQRIKAPKGKCIVFNDTYQYENKDGDIKTVPIVSFEYEYAPATAAEFEERLIETKLEIYDFCLEETNKTFKKTTEDNKKKCSCFSESVIEQLWTIMSENPDAKIDTMGTKILQEAENKCGKLPKSMKK